MSLFFHCGILVPLPPPARYHSRMQRIPPVALTVAGSDCSSGAGMQADLKTFQHFGVHGLTAVTCVVSETADIVRAVHPVPPEMVADQLSLLLESFPVVAIKTGMLFSAAHVAAVAAILARHPTIRLVVDPVMIASTGASLLEDDAIAAYREVLLPLAHLITPNVPEAETLSGKTITTHADLEFAALALSEQFGTAVLAKGGHLEGDDCLDLLAANGQVKHFTARRIPVPGSHGTGCTLSAAITARLALGDSLAKAVAAAKEYLGETLARSYTFQSSGGHSVHALNQGTAWR